MIAGVLAALRRNRGTRLLVGGVLLLAIARLLFGPPAPVVTVVWGEVASGPRRYLEGRFGLTDAAPQPDGKWTYALRDTSQSNRRAFATHPQISGVEGIDPRTYELAGRLPRATWRRRLLSAPEIVASSLELIAIGAMAAGLSLLLLPAGVARAACERGNRASSGVAAWLQRGIPVATAEAAGAFRIVFGAAVVWILASDRVYPELLRPFALAQAEGLYGEAVRWLAAHPQLVTMIQPALVWSGVLFVAGVATRLTFAAFTLVALAWISVYTLNFSAHATAALGLTLVTLLPARWGHALSVDAVVRRSASRVPSRAYGYTFWAPGFVFGVAFAAAAWSKVREGPDWILNGTVKYHFVSDLEHAWVAWGPALTRWHAVAVALTAFAVIAEALLITAAFARSYRYRLVLGLLAAGLLVGFALFQGIVWLGWWVLLLAFLPWHLIGRERTAGSSGPSYASAAQLAAICFVIVQQLVASAKHIEARPVFSTYDMYSTTYATVEDYEAASNLVYRVVEVSGGETTAIPGCVVDDSVAAIARRALEGSARDRELLQHALEGCMRAAPDARQIALEGDRQVFDWNQSRFEWKRRLDVVGPIDAGTIRK